MRAEEELQFMSDFYPDIFPTRKHCLNQLFCVIGNGYEWVNGELVYKDGKYKNRYALKESIKKAEFRNETHWTRMHNFYKDLYEEDGKKIPYNYDFEWYPLCKRFSALFTYPENITDDWKELLEECKQMLIDDGIDIENVPD